MPGLKIRKVTIPTDLLAELNALPSLNARGKLRQFTPEQDAILLQMWPTKIHMHVISFWRKHYGWGGKDVLTRRYRELTDGN